jgi:chemotaxis protein methyltransferase CheR
LIAKDVAAGPPTASPAIVDLELQLLLEAVHRAVGYDFREYSPALVRRRVAERVRAEGVASISGLQEAVLHRHEPMERLIDALTATPSAPFAEPELFAMLREHVIPRLRTFPFVRVWVAGCGAGDDAYALAVLFKEAELAHRVRIYATDASESTVERARQGRVVAADLAAIEHRYAQAGGARRFGDYVVRENNELVYPSSLRDQIVFAQHNLAMDRSFNEFHLIVMHHVITHFNRTLAYRVHQLVFESLVRLGILVLGSRESLRYTPHQRAYAPLPDCDGCYRRIR